MQVIDNSSVVATSDGINYLLDLYPQADYILDVKTLGWGYNFLIDDSKLYYITYSAEFRLIERESSSVITASRCISKQRRGDNPPTKDELLQDNAKLLKELFAEASTACANMFAEKIIKLGPTSADISATE